MSHFIPFALPAVFTLFSAAFPTESPHHCQNARPNSLRQGIPRFNDAYQIGVCGVWLVAQLVVQLVGTGYIWVSEQSPAGTEVVGSTPLPLVPLDAVTSLFETQLSTS
jgi:hypothetical protein